MLHVHVAQLVAKGAVAPGHRSERFRSRHPRVLRPIRPAKLVELDYRSDLLAITKGFKAIVEKHLLPELRQEFPGRLVLDADPSEKIRKIVGGVERRFGGIANVALRTASKHARRSLSAVDRRLEGEIERSIGVNVGAYLSDHGRIASLLGDKVLQNVELIKSIPEEYFQKIVDSVAGHWTEGTRWETLTADIARIGGVTDTRAALIARDQTAKLNSAFNQVRQIDLGIEEYIWRTSGDERVRESHIEVNGQTFRWDEPGPVEAVDGEPCHPGEDIQCRCDAAPVVNLNALLGAA